jgi:hypothetical protein
VEEEGRLREEGRRRAFWCMLQRCCQMRIIPLFVVSILSVCRSLFVTLTFLSLSLNSVPLGVSSSPSLPLSLSPFPPLSLFFSPPPPPPSSSRYPPRHAKDSFHKEYLSTSWQAIVTHRVVVQRDPGSSGHGDNATFFASAHRVESNLRSAYATCAGDEGGGGGAQCRFVIDGDGMHQVH